MVLESQCMLKMSFSGSNTDVKTLSPLVNCIVNDALLHVSPHVNQTSLQVVHIMDICLVDRHVAALRPRFCSQLVQVWAVRRPQIWRDKRRCLTFQKTDCLTHPDNTFLSKNKQFLNINISHCSVVNIYGVVECFIMTLSQIYH